MPRTGSKQLRKGRYSESNRIYFVTSSTYKRRVVFDDFGLGRTLVKELSVEQSRGDLLSLAFVIMPDHFHWLIQLNEGANLSQCMQRTKSRSARALNLRIGSSGRIWQDGYYDHALRRDEDVAGIARYIVANPLRARLVTTVRDYPFWDAIWV